MFSNFGLGGPNWGIETSEYLAGMSMATKTDQEKKIEAFAKELQTNPAFRALCVWLIQSVSNDVLKQARIGAKEYRAELPPGAALFNIEVIGEEAKEANKEFARLIAIISKASLLSLLPFWEERAAEKLLQWTEEGVFPQEKIETAFRLQPNLADFFKAAVARSATQATDQT